jgi:hypothetical protein
MLSILAKTRGNPKFVLPMISHRRNISSILDPDSPEGLKTIPEQLNRGKRENRKYFPSRDRDLTKWPRFYSKNISGNFNENPPSSIQEMVSHFSRRGQSASQRISSTSELYSDIYNSKTKRQKLSKNLGSEDGNSVCGLLLEDALMSDAAVYDASVTFTDDRSNLIAQVILHEEFTGAQFADWLELSGLAQFGDVQWRLVDSIDSGCQNEKLKMQSRHRILDFLDEYGHNRCLNMEEFANFCDNFNIVKSNTSSDVVFSRHDLDEDGLLNFSEFKRFVDTLVF